MMHFLQISYLLLIINTIDNYAFLVDFIFAATNIKTVDDDDLLVDFIFAANNKHYR